MRLVSFLAAGAISLIAGALGAACAKGADNADSRILGADAQDEPVIGDDAGQDTTASDASPDSPADTTLPSDVVGDPVGDPGKQDAVEAGPCTVCDQAGCGACPTVATVVMNGQRIDSIEVTNAQYTAWIATAPKVANQIAACSGNASFVPTQGWPASGKEDQPVSYIDWCDAYAYCAWAKKKLCGKIGGGENAYADFTNPTRSQWFKACTGGGVKTYPYGNTYQPTYCNGSDFGSGDKIVAGQASGCQGAYPGLFDMSGNVWEWEDSCDSSGMCRIRGGSYTNASNALDCGVDSSLPRTTTAASIGFRCCLD